MLFGQAIISARQPVSYQLDMQFPLYAPIHKRFLFMKVALWQLWVISSTALGWEIMAIRSLPLKERRLPFNFN